MKIARLLTTACLLTLGTAYGQPAPDQIGKITVQPVEHASLALSVPGKTIFVDPVGHSDQLNGMKAPDIVLITDIHGDHFSPETLEALHLDHATLAVPQAVADKLPAAYRSRVVVLHNGDQKTIKGISVTAMPMYNLPESPDAFHTKGRGNGYILVLDGKRVYISGDTGGIPEMRSLRDIDLAFVCMNLPFTMDIDHAADAVLAFKPHIVYPYHYRGKSGKSDVAAFKKQVQDKDPAIDVRLRDWYPAEP
ncbi:MBL fold metallo-hydrolase [Compostibacter hankyongensis]|uniref:MBL fold metallo-hydrolase n=1 Tax=Compostibacter hankyongensis TaxID=1007089 RepID=A0ABP8FBW3_9BACT